MKKVILLAALIGHIPLMSQVSSPSDPMRNRAAPIYPALSGFEEPQHTAADANSSTEAFKGPRVIQRSMNLYEEIIGETTYDLQTNRSCQNRISHDSERTAGTWTWSAQTAPASPDRGTGYAWDDGSGWSAYEERIESIRTGWSSLFKTAGGRECVVNHPGDAMFNFIYRDAGTESWTEPSLPTVHSGTGFWWSRACAGGADGNSIHVIGLSKPVASGGALVNDQDGSLMYWRSQDQGATWDIQDFQPEGIGSADFARYTADSYSIVSHGDDIAFAVFHDFADSYVMISHDNGDTWEKTILFDFPVDLYDMNTEIIDENNDGLADTVASTDGSGALLFDNNGMLHATFGDMRYLDDVVGDGGAYVFFPGNPGLRYWNESMGANTSVLIADLEDLDGDGAFAYGTDLANYGVSMTSMSGLAKDDAGNLYVVYSAGVEDLLYDDGNGGTFNYRHLFMKASLDGGSTWGTAVDITPEDVEEESPLIECVYPSVFPEVVNGNVILTYQRDLEPGTIATPASVDDVIEEGNVIIYLEASVDQVLGLNEQSKDSPFKLFPNPSDIGMVNIQGLRGNHQYEINDLQGRKVAEGRLVDGVNVLQVQDLNEGVYLLNIFNATDSYVERFMVK